MRNPDCQSSPVQETGDVGMERSIRSVTVADARHVEPGGMPAIPAIMTTGPQEIRPWRECPFTVGRRYRVRSSFKALRDAFTAGDVLTYEADAWSRYDGITGYFFRQQGGGRLQVWDIDDDADISVWTDLFEELPDDDTRKQA